MQSVRKIFLTSIMFTMRHMWKGRCEETYQGRVRLVGKILGRCKGAIAEYRSIKRKSRGLNSLRRINPSDVPEAWQLRTKEHIKINCDVAFT